MRDSNQSARNQSDKQPDHQPDHQPDNNQKTSNLEPYGFWRTVLIVLCGHLGVRPAHKRVEDFQRANGVHVFAVAVMYFVLVIIGLIVLVNIIAG